MLLQGQTSSSCKPDENCLGDGGVCGNTLVFYCVFNYRYTSIYSLYRHTASKGK